MAVRPDPTPRWVRTALFIPAQRADFLEKSSERGADAVILDLEDAVAEPGKASARDTASAWLERERHQTDPLVMARVNGLRAGDLDADLAAVVGPHLHAVLLPKITDAADVVEVAERLAWFEGRAGLERGHVRIWPIIETAAAIENVAAIARSSSRVAYLGGGTSEQGDLARELGFEWSVAGAETLYVRSRVLVAARAAEVPNPMTGLVSGLADLDDVESFALDARRLGYSGMMVIHPAHVPVVNAVFTPTDEAIAAARQVMGVLETAAVDGVGAVQHDGRMIDVAMARTAERYVEEASRVVESTREERR